MKIHVIHDSNDNVRAKNLDYEIGRQTIQPTYQFWPAIYSDKSCQGISKAHKQIVRANQNEPEIIIMENDIRFPSINGLKYFLQKKPKDFDIYLGGVYAGSPDNIGNIKAFSGMHLYIIRQQFYKTFLSLPENKHIDRAMAGKGKFIVCIPMAAIQYNGYSYNTGRHENYDNLLVGKKIYEDN